jgi:hypothetical protein
MLLWIPLMVVFLRSRSSVLCWSCVWGRGCGVVCYVFWWPKTGRILKIVTRWDTQNPTERRQIPYIISHSTDNSSDRENSNKNFVNYAVHSGIPCESNNLQRHGGTKQGFHRGSGAEMYEQRGDGLYAHDVPCFSYKNMQKRAWKTDDARDIVNLAYITKFLWNVLSCVALSYNTCVYIRIFVELCMYVCMWTAF